MTSLEDIAGFLMVGGLCLLIANVRRKRPRKILPGMDAGFTVPVSQKGYLWAIPLYNPKPLLSRWERKAMADLLAQVPEGFQLCPQVRIADLVAVRGPDPEQNRQAFFKISAKSVDFAVVENQTGMVAVAIELDDRTHNEADRRYRDGLVDAVFERIGIPLLRFSPADRIDIAASFRRRGAL